MLLQLFVGKYMYKKSGVNRLISACSNSANGVIYLLKNEASFRQELACFAVLVCAACYFHLSLVKTLLIIVAGLFVLLVESVNSAIEATIDRIGYDAHPLSKAAKDCGSVAVLISIAIAICAVIAVLLS